MAEQVNQRIQDTINELEQMQRINLYTPEEIREISRKRKEFEYRIQRKIKEKSDYTEYISYEMALLEDISLRRKINNSSEKKKDIEYAISKRLNRVFKQFIYRFQNDINIYHQYINFLISVGFYHAVSGIIVQMLQIHGDKPLCWLAACKWEKEHEHNLESARGFLLRGICRHPDCEVLYEELFNIELSMLSKAETDEDQNKHLQKISIVWKEGMQAIKKSSFLGNLCDESMKYPAADSITAELKKAIWDNNDKKETWAYIAEKELQGFHWKEIEEYLEESDFPMRIKCYMAAYERGLKLFPDESMFSRYFYGLLDVDVTICERTQSIEAVKQAWLFGIENDIMPEKLYSIGFQMMQICDEAQFEILEMAIKRKPQVSFLWELKIRNTINNDEKGLLTILADATKVLDQTSLLNLWETVLCRVKSKDLLQDLYKKVQNCESMVLLSLKPKLLKRMYSIMGLKAARKMYDDFVRLPPLQLEIHRVMIDIELSQEIVNLKSIRKCFECALHHHGAESVEIWTEYIQFELENGNHQGVSMIHRRALSTLKKELKTEFIQSRI